MSGCADSLTSRLPVPSATCFRKFAPDPRTDESPGRLQFKKEFKSEDSIVRRYPGSFPATAQPR